MRNVNKKIRALRGAEGLWKKVLRIDGPFRAQGFLSLTALRAEGCGIALTGDEYKASVTDLLSVSYDMLPTVQGGGASHQRGKRRNGT